MATIYTARSTVGNEKTTPLFSLKGLPNLVPATISSLNITGIPLEKQLAYTQYSSNIACFLYATSIGKTLTVSPRPLGKLTSSAVLPLNPPTVAFPLIKALDSDRSEKFLSVLGPGSSKTQSGKTTIYHAPALPVHSIPSILRISAPFFNAGRDAVNPKGMQAYLFLSNIAALFVTVHSYPAFRNEDKDSLIAFEQLVGGELGGLYYSKEVKTKDDKGAEKIDVKDLSEKSYSVNEYNKRVISEDTMEEDENPLAKKANTSGGHLVFRGNETVSKAHPTRKAGNNVGAIGDIPKSPGLVFPYFVGLIQPDPVFLNTMVLRHFYRLLGDSHESCQSHYLDIRHGINSLASTVQGMEMAHIFLGIDLALETQSRCFLIIEKSRYCGFSLIGAKFAIFSGTRWVAPVTEEELDLAVHRMDPHEAAVDDIIAKLETLKASDKYSGMVNRTMFSEPDLLASEVEKIKLSEVDEDDVRELDRCIRNLNYMGTAYLSQNPQMITELLTTISSSANLTLSRPTYIPTIRAPLKSKLFIALSRFGPEAPSFWNDRGTEIVCKPIEKSVVSTGGKRKIGQADTYGNMPDKILVTPKPLLVAMKDMEKVIEKGRVKMDIGERAGRYRNVSVEHEETRKSMWAGLIAVCADSEKKLKIDENKGIEASGEVDLDAIMASLLG